MWRMKPEEKGKMVEEKDVMARAVRQLSHIGRPEGGVPVNAVVQRREEETKGMPACLLYPAQVAIVKRVSARRHALARPLQPKGSRAPYFGGTPTSSSTSNPATAATDEYYVPRAPRTWKGESSDKEAVAGFREGHARLRAVERKHVGCSKP